MVSNFCSIAAQYIRLRVFHIKLVVPRYLTYLGFMVSNFCSIAAQYISLRELLPANNREIYEKLENEKQQKIIKTYTKTKNFEGNCNLVEEK